MQRMYCPWLVTFLLSLSTSFVSAEPGIPDYDPVFSIVVNTTSAEPQKLNYGSCKEACNSLSNLLPRSIAADLDHPTHISQSRSLYWAQQQSAIEPACYVHIRTAADLSTAISVSRSTQCPFAVRGGGHSDVPGASNSPGGITLDLAGLNQIETTEDGKVTKLGAGLTWGAVYGVLGKKNLTVVGGRLTSVGVAGLTLGGGISHFSGLYGFACDNVRNFEVVLANGSIVDVSFDSPHSDLYRALRGGGNNFGIVSRFDLDTYPQGPMWGGLQVWSHNSKVTSSVTSAFTTFAGAASSDPNASMFLGLGYKNGAYVYAAGLQYALPTAFPPIFGDFVADPEFTASRIASTARITSMSDLADELDKAEPPGIRSRFTTATFKVDTELQRIILAIYKEEVSHVVDVGLHDASNFAPMMGFQPLTSVILQQNLKRGGNVLGLSPEDAPLMVCSFGWEWSSEVDDALVIGGIGNVLHRSIAAAKEMGLYNDYIYMNYAAPDQKPIESYGKQNREFLEEVQKRYDPEGVFTRLVPGGFKLH